MRDTRRRRVQFYGRHFQAGYELDAVQAHWGGVTAEYVDRAREGLNDMCVSCFGRPLAGGLRCLGCFSETVRRRRVAA